MKSAPQSRRLRSARRITAAGFLLAATSLLGACALGEGKKVTEEVTPIYSAASPEFRQATGSLLGGNFVAGNSITTLENGREIFPGDAERDSRREADDQLRDLYFLGWGDCKAVLPRRWRNGRTRA